MNILTTMKQALEALDDFNKHKHNHGMSWAGKHVDALKTAIQQIEKAEPELWAHETDWEFSEKCSGRTPVPLYIYPPDAQVEIERLTKERNAFQNQCIALKQESHELRQQLAVREGWQLVPQKATPAIRDALRLSGRKDYPSDELCNVRWAAALAKANKIGFEK